MTIAEIIAAYRDLSVSEIARRASRSPQSVRQILHGAGVVMRPPGGATLQLDQAETARTIRLYRQLGSGSTARVLGIYPSSVQARLVAAGEPRTYVQPPRPVPDGYETPQDVATRLGVGEARVRQLLRAGRIPGATKTTDGRWLIAPTSNEATP